MRDQQTAIRGYRVTFTGLGLLYVFMAGSMLVEGVGAMRDFGVSEALLDSPVFEDFFLIFYELMAVVGVLMVVAGHTVRERRGQMLVSAVFAAVNLYFAARDLSTSDSSFGNRLYEGEATLFFVVVDLVFALAFVALAVLGLRVGRRPGDERVTGVPPRASRARRGS